MEIGSASGYQCGAFCSDSNSQMHSIVKSVHNDIKSLGEITQFTDECKTVPSGCRPSDEANKCWAAVVCTEHIPLLLTSNPLLLISNPLLLSSLKTDTDLTTVEGQVDL